MYHSRQHMRWIVLLSIMTMTVRSAYEGEAGEESLMDLRKTDGSQPISSQDRQIKLTDGCFACLRRFCEERVVALPSTNRYCCEKRVLDFVGYEIACTRFRSRGPQAVENCYKHKSDWNICVNFVLDDVCRGCASWGAPGNNDTRTVEERLEAAFDERDYAEERYYGSDLDLYGTHGKIVRPDPRDRSVNTSVVQTVRNHTCEQDASCGNHGVADSVHYGDYVMPVHVERELSMISLEGYNPAFNASLFRPNCVMDDPEGGTGNGCVVQLSQLDMRLRACEPDEDCTGTYVSILDLADAWNIPRNLSFIWP